MNTRKMQHSDLKEVVLIEQAANQFPWSARNFEDCLKAGHEAWIFENNDEEMIGYTIVQHVVDEAHLLNICVKPSEQGQGFGRKILNHVIDYAEGIAAVLIVLEVRRSNQRAQQLYLQAGFNEMSVRKGYYPGENDREDAILMGMDLALMSFFADN